MLSTPTWRASADWARRLGLSQTQMDELNRQSVNEMQRLQMEFETPESPMPICGCIGPRGDGYSPRNRMTVAEATQYHDRQIGVLANAATDFISAATLNYIEEAIGVIQAARLHNIPVEISFTVETDGHLPTGEPLADAITKCDRETDHYATNYMVNCAHPSHFSDVLDTEESWLKRLGSIRANASRLSHAELDNSTELDAGNPTELAAEIMSLTESATEITVFGGCCGTDHRHIAEIAKSVSMKHAVAER